MTDGGIETAVELWDAFIDRAGLQTALRRDGSDGFDAGLLATLRTALGLPTGPIRTGLMSSRCSLENLLSAVLFSFEPWSRMMSDILSTLAEAAAKSGNSITLHARLNDALPELRETLESFARQTQASHEVVASSSGRRWGEVDLWALAAIGERSSAQDGEAPYHRSTADELSPAVREWLDAYLEGDRAPTPPLVASGYPEYDDAMLEMRRALDSCLRASRVAGDTKAVRHEQFRRGGDRDFGDGWLGHAMFALDFDSVVGIVIRTFDALTKSPDWGPGTAAYVARRLRAELTKASPTLSVERRASLLLDLLDLPVWKRRHELYSVWIATLIRKAARSAAPHAEWAWRSQDGVLAFPFSGAVVAELSSAGGTAYLWAELRRKADGTGRKRRRHVQPDYTMLLGPDGKSSPAGLVVECKQYRRPSASNFNAALEDYAAAHPEACVGLFNYGPAGTSVTATSAALSTSRPRPVRAIGMVQPRGVGEATALHLLKDEIGRLELLRPIPVSEVSVPCGFEAAKTRCRIELTWAEGGDLDLHLIGDDGDHVYHASRGSLTESPFMWLEDDLRGPGTERALVSQGRRGVCTVKVLVYGNSESAQGTALVTIDLGRERRYFRSPAHAWREWIVCSMDLDQGLVEPNDA